MKNVHVMPLLSRTQHPLLPETLHAHGRVAMNAPVLRCLLKTMEQPMDRGFYVAQGRHLSLSCQHLQCPGTFTLNSFLPVGRKTKGNTLQPCNYSNPTLNCKLNILHDTSCD